MQSRDGIGELIALARHTDLYEYEVSDLIGRLGPDGLYMGLRLRFTNPAECSFLLGLKLSPHTHRDKEKESIDLSLSKFINGIVRKAHQQILHTTQQQQHLSLSADSLKVLALCLIRDEAATVVAIRAADPSGDEDKDQDHQSWAYRSISKTTTAAPSGNNTGNVGKESKDNGSNNNNFYILMQALLAQLNAKPNKNNKETAKTKTTTRSGNNNSTNTGTGRTTKREKVKSINSKANTSDKTDEIDNIDSSGASSSSGGAKESDGLILALACLPPLLANVSHSVVSDSSDSSSVQVQEQERALAEAVMAPENVRQMLKLALHTASHPYSGR